MNNGAAEPIDLRDRIAKINATFAAGIASLEEVTRHDGAITAKDKAILLVAATAVRDREATTPEVKHALELGNDGSQLQAVALALYLSRGAGPCRAVLNAIDELDATPTVEVLREANEDSIEEILAEFVAVFGEVPERVSLLADFSTEGLEAYHRMRTSVLRAGDLEPVVAELALMCVNAAEHRSDYAQIHAAGARRAGATDAQLVEAGICSIPSGGVAAWLAASEAIISTQPTQE